MIRQSKEGEERKKRLQGAATGEETGFKKDESDITLNPVDDDIDPADFFDPEEFGIRRHVEPLRP